MANVHVLQIAIGIGIAIAIGFEIDCCAHAVARSDKCNDGGDSDPDGDSDGAAMEP
ncbi:MAG TPA: hypothetical protein PLH01_01815 [Kiritimatiellia bacterium]|nr:hypothetical protein [Kiritimatiellia bacterium]